MSRPQDVHANSIEAYHSEEPKLSARAGAILAWIHVHGAATDRQVVSGMGFLDMNTVRPRITELIDAGMLEEIGNIRCVTTGKTVRRVDVPRPGQRPLFQ